ncbi:hypothetical protein NKR23_g10275 [Pleurostoma richardsiae]|uniref:protein-tyrosine-phosphatase n=1 Tax=Pleurostoma richardsiae TaxID=41990 RepID=A0AA38VEE3_9PEZI|nr:hypothetical protein NKR23_g10275 [Pleurostoma richardsiae]
MARKKQKLSFSSNPAKDNTAAQILPYLYLGSRSSAAPENALASGITHIVSIGCRPAGGGHASISYHRISLRDNPTEDLHTPARLVAEIIRNAKAKHTGARVLVHCVAGVSRSAAVVASYLVEEEGLSLREALALLIRMRPAVRPNDGFLKQLQKLEREVTGDSSLVSATLPLRLREKLEVLGIAMGAVGISDKPQAQIFPR